MSLRVRAILRRSGEPSPHDGPPAARRISAHGPLWPIIRPLLLGAYLVVSNGGMAGNTVVSWATVFMSDVFTGMPDELSDIVLRWPSVFMSYTIYGAVALARSPFLSDTISDCVTVRSAASSEGVPSLLSDTIASRIPCVSDVQEGVSAWGTDVSSAFAVFVSDAILDSLCMSDRYGLSSHELPHFCQTSFQLCLMCCQTYFFRMLLSIVSDTIEAVCGFTQIMSNNTMVGPLCPSLFLYDAISDYAAVRLPAARGDPLCCLTLCLAMCLVCLTCEWTHAGPAVVRTRVRPTC
jgi:hypothetical protein